MRTLESEIICPKSREEWRQWLQDHHDTEQSVWLLYYKKHSNVQTLTWSEAVEEALCFGWIDSKRQSVDTETFRQFFSRRKAVSTWSKVNKRIVQELIESGRMMPAGLLSIEIAKQNHSWTLLDAVEELQISEDLEQAFANHPGSKDYFQSLSRSTQKVMLQWLVLAKRPETRQSRINEIAGSAAQKQKPKPFQ